MTGVQTCALPIYVGMLTPQDNVDPDLAEDRDPSETVTNEVYSWKKLMDTDGY